MSRRAVLQSTVVLAAGGIGAAAGFGLRDLIDERPAPAPPPGPGVSGQVAAETGVPGASGATPPTELAGPRLAFRSRPDLRPPALLAGTPANGTAPGLLFTTPNNGDGPDGPTVYDQTGEPVWIRAGMGRRATDLHVIELRGRPALTWWEGEAVEGVGTGEYVVVDDTYAEIARIAAGADLHELHLTSEGTALFIAYEPVDLPAGSVPSPSPGGSPSSTKVYDCVVYEVHVERGEVRFEWHSADHIGMDEAFVGVSEDPEKPHDPVHANSVHLDDDGTVLLSARNTSAIYKIDRATGEIRWRLGGRRNDFRLLGGFSIGYQHDARRQPDGTLTIFDNRQPPEIARGLVVRLDETAMTASLVRTFERPEPLHAASQGSLQVLPNGNVLVGWGSQAVMTEFTADGRVVFDAAMPAGAQSYRNRRHPWTGRPAEPPALAVDPVRKASGGQWRVTAHASWNGATEVRAWALLAGPAEDRLERLSTMARTGFETVLTGVTATEGLTHAQAIALDAEGRELAASAVTQLA